LFVILWLFSRRERSAGVIGSAFLIGYGLLRFIAEFGREPDSFLGLLALRLSMGQWLSIPMVVIGTGLMVYFIRFRPAVAVASPRIDKKARKEAT
jgi:phosphatidylglycerol:prolipoprotein diacylglycerol transferase